MALSEREFSASRGAPEVDEYLRGKVWIEWQIYEIFFDTSLIGEFSISKYFTEAITEI